MYFVIWPLLSIFISLNFNKVIELCEDGILDWEDLARECVAYMSEDDVNDMASTVGWFDDEEDSDEENEKEE